MYMYIFICTYKYKYLYLLGSVTEVLGSFVADLNTSCRALLWSCRTLSLRKRLSLFCIVLSLFSFAKIDRKKSPTPGGFPIYCVP